MNSENLPNDEGLAELQRGSGIQVFYVGNKRLPIVDRGEGIYLWDTNGKRYLDACSGPICTNLGHGNPAVLQAMQEQAAKVCYANRANFENQANIDLAAKLLDLTGPDFDQAYFVSGGSEATETAIKMARQYAVTTGQEKRWKVLARDPGYHGATLGAVTVTGDPASKRIYDAVTRVMPKVPAPFSYRVPDGYDSDSYARHCAQALEDAILAEGADTVLAFIMEPVGGVATGALVAPDHYYRTIREICDRHGVLLIFDEVMSGAGRTGRFLAADHWPDARPDLVILAKGIAAGYTPFGAVLAPNRIVAPLVVAGGFQHGHTYAGNPLSCAVANAVVGEMQRLNLIEKAGQIGQYLRDRLLTLADEVSVIGDVRGIGLLLAVEIVADKQTRVQIPPETLPVYRLMELAMNNGLLLYARQTAGGIYGEWVMLTPPLTTTEAEVDELIELFRATLLDFQNELGIL